jgi:hypothetical protein
MADRRRKKWEKRAMTRLTAVALALAFASPTQAMPVAPVQPLDSMITQVREGCGLGRIMVNGQCVSRHDIRQASRAAATGAYVAAAPTAPANAPSYVLEAVPIQPGLSATVTDPATGRQCTISSDGHRWCWTP